MIKIFWSALVHLYLPAVAYGCKCNTEIRFSFQSIGGTPNTHTQSAAYWKWDCGTALCFWCLMWEFPAAKVIPQSSAVASSVERKEAEEMEIKFNLISKPSFILLYWIVFSKGILLPGELGFLVPHHSSPTFPISMQGELHHPARVSPISVSCSAKQVAVDTGSPCCWCSTNNLQAPAARLLAVSAESYDLISHVGFSGVPFVSKASPLWII